MHVLYPEIKPYRVHRLAVDPPHELYVEGVNSAEFARTESRLIEMQSREYLASLRREL